MRRRASIISSRIGVEYTTENTWIGVEAPSCPKKIYEAGLEIVKGLDQFHSNPIHWEELLGSIADAASGAAPLLSLIPTAGPVLGGISGFIGTSARIAKDVLFGRSEESAANPQLEKPKQRIQEQTQLSIPLSQINAAETAMVVSQPSRTRKRTRGMYVNG